MGSTMATEDHDLRTPGRPEVTHVPLTGAKRRVKAVLAHPTVSRPLTSTLRPVARWLPDSVLFRIPLFGAFPVEIPSSAAGFRLDASAGDSIATTLYWRGLRAYETHTVDLLTALSPRTSVFIDVGANVGIYSLLMAALNPATEVHAIEPVPTIFSLLQGNAALNSLANLHLHQLAISDTTGQTVIHVPVNHTVPIEASLLAGFRPDTRPVKVSVATLDGFVEGLEGAGPSVVKIDTEGTTALVLKGAGAVLRKHRPLLICEVLPGIDSESCLGPVLADLGYTGFLLTRSGPRRVTDIVGDPTFQNINYLFVHRSLLASLAGIL